MICISVARNAFISSASNIVARRHGLGRGLAELRAVPQPKERRALARGDALHYHVLWPIYGTHVSHMRVLSFFSGLPLLYTKRKIFAKREFF